MHDKSKPLTILSMIKGSPHIQYRALPLSTSPLSKYQIILPGDRGMHACVNNLPTDIMRRRMARHQNDNVLMVNPTITLVLAFHTNFQSSNISQNNNNITVKTCDSAVKCILSDSVVTNILQCVLGLNGWLTDALPTRFLSLFWVISMKRTSQRSSIDCDLATTFS